MPQPKRTWTKKIRPIVVEGDVALVPLSDGSVAVIDAADVGLVSRWNWTVVDTGHVHRGTGPSKRRLANEILSPPPGFLVDHKDGDPRNNRRGNLRIASYAQNAQNRRLSRANTSGFKGVHFRKDRGTWLATIGHKGRQTKLGNFGTAEEAARAYDAAARKHFGEFAVLNFPDEAA